MFFSWKPCGDGSNVLNPELPLAFDPVTAKTQGPQACANCRGRKVKCVGNTRHGCQRCRTTGRKCTYDTTTTNAKSSSGNNNTRRKSSESGLSQQQAKRTKSVSVSSGGGVSPEQILLDAQQRPVTASSQASTPSLLTDVGTASTVDPSSLSADEMDMWSMFSDGRPDDSISVMKDVAMSVDFDRPSDEDTTFHIAMGGGESDFASNGAFGNTEFLGSWDSSNGILTAPASTTPSTPARDHHALSNLGINPGSSEASDQLTTSCQCLKQLVIFMDEIESIVNRSTSASLDGALAAHKEALTIGAQMLHCPVCPDRVEHMIILALMVYQLVRMCRCMADVCCTGLQAAAATPTPDDGNHSHSHTDGGGGGNTRMHQGGDGGSDGGGGGGGGGGGEASSPPHQTPILSIRAHDTMTKHGLRVGGGGLGGGGQESGAMTVPRSDYRVDSVGEYFFVISGMLRFQLLQLSQLLQHLRKVAAPLASDIITQRLRVCDREVEIMLRQAGLFDAATAFPPQQITASPSQETGAA